MQPDPVEIETLHRRCRPNRIQHASVVQAPEGAKCCVANCGRDAVFQRSSYTLSAGWTTTDLCYGHGFER